MALGKGQVLVVLSLHHPRSAKTFRAALRKWMTGHLRIAKVWYNRLGWPALPFGVSNMGPRPLQKHLCLSSRRLGSGHFQQPRMRPPQGDGFREGIKSFITANDQKDHALGCPKVLADASDVHY